MKVCSVVVTYNRIKFLEENINALLSQTFKEADIFIVDNASTDGTAEFIKGLEDERIKYFNTGANLGGAGGFSYAIKKAIEEQYDYALLMDDDAIPEPTTLEKLVKKANDLNDDFSFLATTVRWTDGALFPMNVPEYRIKGKKNLAALENICNGIIEIKSCSFVGCFVNVSKVWKKGLPIKEFFIYGDDMEYTLRISKVAKAYLVYDSLIVHKSPSNVGVDIAKIDKSKMNRIYYASRNGMYIARKNHRVIKRIIKMLTISLRILFKSENKRFKRLFIYWKGFFGGLFFHPKIEIVKFDK